MVKLFKISKHYAKRLLSPAYRHRYTLKRGRKIWLSLNKNLPKATGLSFDDEPRLERFKIKVSCLPSSDQHALKKWLEYQLEDLQKNPTDDISYLIEKEEEKLRKIYQEHLSLIP